MQPRSGDRRAGDDDRWLRDFLALPGLSVIREADAIAQVVRGFGDSDVMHTPLQRVKQARPASVLV